MNRIHKYALLLPLALLPFISASAQKEWTIDDCMRYAADHNFDVRTAELSLTDSKSDHRKAKASFFPTVGASLSTTYSFGRSIDPATNTYDNLTTFYNYYGASLSWTIFAGGSIINDFKKAKTRKMMAATAVESQRDEVAIAVMDAYISSLYYSLLIPITEAKKDESLALLEKTKRMKELGLCSAVELSQAQAQFAADDYTLANTISVSKTENLKLKSTMNYPVSDSLRLSETIGSLPPCNLSAAEIMEFACANNPLVRQARLNAEAAKYSLRSARGSFAPSISLNAGLSSYYYSYTGTENMPFKKQMDINFGQYVGLSMSIPLFDGLSRSTTARKAKTASIQAGIELDRKLYDLQMGIEQTVAECQSLEKEIGKMQSKADADSIAYSFAKRKYEEGLMSFIDMQQMSSTWFESQANLLRSRLLYAVKLRLAKYYRTNKLY